MESKGNLNSLVRPLLQVVFNKLQINFKTQNLLKLLIRFSLNLSKVFSHQRFYLFTWYTLSMGSSYQVHAIRHVTGPTSFDVAKESRNIDAPLAILSRSHSPDYDLLPHRRQAVRTNVSGMAGNENWDSFCREATELKENATAFYSERKYDNMSLSLSLSLDHRSVVWQEMALW